MNVFVLASQIGGAIQVEVYADKETALLRATQHKAAADMMGHVAQINVLELPVHERIPAT